MSRKIQNALLKLAATGPNGFEGLIRDAFQEAVGITLRLLKSGQQGGVDAVTGAEANLFSVGIEAKRYKPKTSLKLDDLKAKLIDAASRTGEPIEVWILVASKEVSADDLKELEKIGDEKGITVLVLDWTSYDNPSLFASLPLFLSLAPSAVNRHLEDDVAQGIRDIKSLEGYDAASKSLIEKLKQPSLGFFSAKIQIRNKLAETLTSRADSKAKFKTPIDFLNDDRRWVHRDDLCSQIDAWVVSASEIPVCALVGKEGAGKTWLMFNWWKRITSQDSLPLILWVSARDIGSLDLLGILSLSMEKWFGSHDKTYWEKRLSWSTM